MNNQLYVLVVLLLVTFTVNVSCVSVVGPPIPDITDGLKLGAKSATSPRVIVEFFMDLTCSDTADLWTTFYKDFIQTVTNKNLPVQFHLHNYPLPYHIAAFEAAKAYIIVNNITNSISNSNYLYEFVDACLENQYPLLNVADMNQKQIQDLIFSTYFQPLNIPISKEAYIKQMNIRDTWDHGRRLFKLATSKAVFGTPMFFINGVQVYNADSWSQDDWMTIFQSLLQ